MRKLKKSLPYSIIAVVLFLILVLAFVISRFMKRTTPLDSRVLGASKYATMKNILEAQARHETGRYTSLLYLRANNLFGMKNASGSRAKTQMGFQVEGDQYRHYKNNEESIADLIDYLNNFKEPVYDDSEQGVIAYAKKLKKNGYYADSAENYTNGLLKHYRST